MIAGERLRALREKLGFTLKDVEEASWRLVRERNNPRYSLPQSGLSHIESKGIVPNIYKLEALAIIYGRAMSELLGWYGVGQQHSECGAKAPKTNLLSALGEQNCSLPLRLDPMFDQTKTSYIRRMIQEWGIRPIAALASLPQREFTYGYVGTEDYTLYPLILPGSFVQIDPKLTDVETGPWTSDLERPVYFLETRDSYICGWCALISSKEIQVQPHALSGLQARNYRLPNEIEIVGRVVGIAMKLRSAMHDLEQESVAIPAQN